jgi:hypothetical protein
MRLPCRFAREHALARDSGRLAALAPLVALASLGCSLVSGWNDLQNGTRADAAPPADASAPPVADSGADSGSEQPTPGTDSGPVADASLPGPDASSVLMTVACGSTRCAVGEGCCTSILGGAPACQASAASCMPPKTFASCSDSTQCTATLAHAAQCCEETSSGVPSVSCRTTCTSTGSVVCDPTLLSPGCTAGQTCKPSSDGFGYNTCQ